MLEDVPKPRVLVVDDDHPTADTLALILNRSGFEARAVYSGEAALALAPEFQPRTMVCDIIMGGINGIETMIRMKSLQPGIRIVLISGQVATAGQLEKARAEGHEFDLMAKPVHPQDLLNKLRG